MDITLLRSRIFSDDRVKMKSLGWVLVQYISVLVMMGNVDPEVEMHYTFPFNPHSSSTGKVPMIPNSSWGSEKLRHKARLTQPTSAQPWFEPREKETLNRPPWLTGGYPRRMRMVLGDSSQTPGSKWLLRLLKLRGWALRVPDGSSTQDSVCPPHQALWEGSSIC